jgi:hypothetical protein
MKKVKMLKTFGTRVKGFVYPVTERFAGILIEAGVATDDLSEELSEKKEDKEAAGRETKEVKTKKTRK